MASVSDAGVLCADVYAFQKKGTRVAGTTAVWERVENYGPDGAPLDAPTTSWFDTGFFAALYKRVDTTEYVLAVRGTDGLLDWLTSNAMLSGGFTPDQYRPARFAFSWAHGLAKREFTLTGHSLGGGLAFMLSGEFGVPVVTFNAPHMLSVRPSASKLSRASQVIRGLTHFLGASIRPGTWNRKDASRMIHVRMTEDIVSSPRIWGLASWLYALGRDTLPGELWTLNPAPGKAVPPEFPDVPMSGNPEIDDAASTAALGKYAMQRGVFHFHRHIMVTINDAIDALPKPEKDRYRKDLLWVP